MQITDHCISIQLTIWTQYLLPTVVWSIVATMASFSLIPPLSACILMNWLNPHYGSLFSLILSTCMWSLYIPMVELNQYFGLSKVSLQSSDTCWTYANEFNTDLPDWMSLSLPLFQDFSPSLDLVLAMCAHHLGAYTLCVINSMHFHTTLQAMKIMLICGFHLHYRYSIGIYIYYFIIHLDYRVVCKELWQCKLHYCVRNCVCL